MLPEWFEILFKSIILCASQNYTPLFVLFLCQSRKCFVGSRIWHCEFALTQWVQVFRVVEYFRGFAMIYVIIIVISPLIYCEISWILNVECYTHVSLSLFWSFKSSTNESKCILKLFRSIKCNDGRFMWYFSAFWCLICHSVCSRDLWHTKGKLSRRFE